MTNHRPRPAGAIPNASMDIFVFTRILDLRILFERVKSLRMLQYHGMHLLEIRINNLLSEVENIAFLPVGTGVSPINRAFMKYRRLQFILNELECPSAARPPLSKFDRNFVGLQSSGAADEV